MFFLGRLLNLTGVAGFPQVKSSCQFTVSFGVSAAKLQHMCEKEKGRRASQIPEERRKFHMDLLSLFSSRRGDLQYGKSKGVAFCAKKGEKSLQVSKPKKGAQLEDNPPMFNQGDTMGPRMIGSVSPKSKGPLLKYGCLSYAVTILLYQSHP